MSSVCSGKEEQTMADNTPVDAECGSGSEEDRKQTAVSSMISPPEVEQDGGASEELGLAKSAFDNAVIHTSAVSAANATGTSSSSSSSSATEKDFLSEPALVSLVEQGSHKGFEITGENNKNTTWEHAHTAVVEIEDKAEHGNASPNTSIHLVYSRPTEIGSPPATVSSPVLSETAKSINIIDKKQNYYIIRRNRARSLPGDEDDTPAKKMCHR
jgi:hypothetical protein